MLKKIIRSFKSRIFGFIKNRFPLIGYKIERFKQERKNFYELRINFERFHGYELDLTEPKSFNSKIIYKMLYDRNPQIPKIADKIEVKKYIKEVFKNSKISVDVFPTIFTTSNPKDIPFDELPDEYVIKPNHASNQIIFVTKKDEINRKETIKKCKHWLSKSFSIEGLEWCYQPIKRKILIEPLMRDSSNKIPHDYKFLMINGVCEYILVKNNNPDEESQSGYNTKWEKLNVELNLKGELNVDRPVKFESMLSAAKIIGNNFDFIRVDFYLINEKLYIGELTNYPARGMIKFNPVEFDFKLGSKWSFDTSYHRNNYIV